MFKPTLTGMPMAFAMVGPFTFPMLAQNLRKQSVPAYTCCEGVSMSDGWFAVRTQTIAYWQSPDHYTQVRLCQRQNVLVGIRGKHMYDACPVPHQHKDDGHHRNLYHQLSKGVEACQCRRRASSSLLPISRKSYIYIGEKALSRAISLLDSLKCQARCCYPELC